jgi:predicted amidophosphoribosyltransferase
VAPRLTAIDEWIASEHHWLRGDEGCYFLREYTPGVGYKASDTNSLISNLKKAPDRRHLPEWKYKLRAIAQVAQELARSLPPDWIAEAAFVPVPPSRTPKHKLYDDRMSDVLASLEKLLDRQLDIRWLLRQTEDREPAHAQGNRLGPGQLEGILEIDEDQTKPEPKLIVVVDDVITTGAHFVAARNLLKHRFEGVQVRGLFVARSAHAPS